MIPATLRRLAQVWTGAALVLLALGVLVPRSAEASCSHLAISAAQRSLVGSDLGVIDRVELVGNFAENAPLEAPSEHKPCSGAFCSGQPGVPLSTVISDTPPSDSWAIVVAPQYVLLPDGNIIQHDDDEIRPIHEGAAIFHPPRPSDRATRA